MSFIEKQGGLGSTRDGGARRFPPVWMARGYGGEPRRAGCRRTPSLPWFGLGGTSRGGPPRAPSGVVARGVTWLNRNGEPPGGRCPASRLEGPTARAEVQSLGQSGRAPLFERCVLPSAWHRIGAKEPRSGPTFSSDSPSACPPGGACHLDSRRSLALAPQPPRVLADRALRRRVERRVGARRGRVGATRGARRLRRARQGSPSDTGRQRLVEGPDGAPPGAPGSSGPLVEWFRDARWRSLLNQLRRA